MTAPPVVTEACVHFYFTLHARPSDAAGIRLSLRPLYFEARDQGHSSGKACRGNVFRCLKENLSSSPAQAGDSVLRSRCWREQTIAGGYWMPWQSNCLAGLSRGMTTERRRRPTISQSRSL